MVEAAIRFELEKILPGYLKTCRWFGGKARKLAGISIEQVLNLRSKFSQRNFELLVLKIKYQSGKSEEYLLPVTEIPSAENIPEKGIITKTNRGFLIDAIYDEDFRKEIFSLLFHSEIVKQKSGSIIFERGIGFSEEGFSPHIPSRVLDADQSNSSIIYDERYFLKLYRKLFRETNPDVEMVKFLSEKALFTHIPAFAGTFYRKKTSGVPITFGMMQQKVEAVKDVWSLCGDYLNEFLHSLKEEKMVIPKASIEQALFLGTRTAEMHLALAGDSVDAAFAPEKFNDNYCDWLLNNCDSLLKKRLRLTKDCYSSLDEEGRTLSKFFFSNQPKIREFFFLIRKKNLPGLRTRIHGDYHLGQLLFTGSDYVILDFEGEPESSIAERKIKHSPLKDVAGMLRSFHYAVSAKLYFSEESKNFSGEKIESAVTGWYEEVSTKFMKSYWETMSTGQILSENKRENEFLLQFHLLEKAIYELGYELNSRPAWVKIPLKGIQHVLSQIT